VPGSDRSWKAMLVRTPDATTVHGFHKAAARKCDKNTHPPRTRPSIQCWRTAMCVTGLRCALISCVCVVLASPLAQAQGITQPKQGQGGSVVKGAAGTDGSTGDKGLEHCDKPMGAMAVVEPQTEILTALMRYKLQSP